MLKKIYINIIKRLINLVKSKSFLIYRLPSINNQQIAFLFHISQNTTIIEKQNDESKRIRIKDIGNRS